MDKTIMHSTKDIAAKLNCPPRTVTRICQRLGIEKQGRDYLLTDEQVEQVRQNYHGRTGNPNWRKR